MFKFAAAKERILIFSSKYLTNKIQFIAHFLLLCASINKIMVKKIAIFASGEGTNAENVIRYFADKPEVNVEIVFCNKPIAGVIVRAAKLGVSTCSFCHADLYQTGNVLHRLRNLDIDFIVLSGFMIRMPEDILRSYQQRIVNIHPALLPKFGGKGMYGIHVHEAVKAAGETESGITIHFVNEVYDSGQIIFQAKCLLSLEDTPEEIAAKVHQLEYLYFPEIIEQIVMKL